VEEEILLQEEHSGQNSAANNEEDPTMDSVTANDFPTATMDEDPGKNEAENETDE
jgi:hypothetical protein